MSIARAIRRLLWKAEGFVHSLESLDESHGLITKKDVTFALGGSNEGHPLTVVELAEGKIIGDLRMVATSADVVVGGLQSLYGSPDPQNHYLPRRRRFRIPIRRRATALLLGAANSDNYYHWLVDSVPRWKMLQAAEWVNYDFVLLHSKPLRFQDEVLDRMGIPVEKRLRCSKNYVHQFDRLIVPANPPHDVSPWVAAYLRSLFPGKGSGPEKIYLPRGTGARRRLVNQNELERALKARGFVSLDPGLLSVSDQAKRFSAARCVVAPHGAALTNLIFSPSGALLLELFHPQHKNECYSNVAAGCGHRYASLDGRAVAPATPSNLDYVVDVDAVLQTLAENGWSV